MTTQDMQDRVLAALPGGRARFDPITLIVLGALISSVIAHFVEKSLRKCEARSIRNPGFIARWQLRRQIRAAWFDPTVAQASSVSSVDAAALDRMYGDDVHKALLRAAASLTDSEIDALKAS